MPVDARRVKELFGAALDIPEAAAREAYLDRECGDDAELRQRLDALLKAHEAPASAVKQPLAGEGTVAFAASEKPGTVVAGRYKLLESIGEGGMGTVWVAEQTEPVRRKVAIKLIKAGMDSRSVLARFEAERQALAMMDHPNIARVLDAGTTETGRPYFVMELVRGIPITDYCDQNHLTPAERLELFVSVCHAIQHAHQKGIIHRDIKPSNVLVTSHDGKPVAKVIDFGVAKAIHQHLTERTIYTQFAQMIGTPLYMSPEQAEMSGLDIDTRTDVYSLGVLLYELLTGTTPLEKKRLAKAAYDEIRRVIREEDPPRPSDRLSTSETLPSLAANRKTEPTRLSRMLKGELDWIVMKALEKDRTRRYETANGFARDIQRYLADEVVEARPPSAGYRLRKFMKRNQGKVLAASLLLIAMLAGVIGTTWGMIESRRQAKIAREQEAEAIKQAALARSETEAKELARAAEEKQRLDAEAAKKRANDEKQVAQAVKDFLQKKLLVQADTRAQADALMKGGGLAAEAKLNPTIRELLDRAATELKQDKIEENFPNQPLVQADLLNTVGVTYLGIGVADTAIDFLKRSVEMFRRHRGPGHPDTLASMNGLAYSYLVAGKLALALPLFEETLKLTKTNLNPNNPNSLIIITNLAEGYRAAGKLTLALPLYEEALKIAKEKLGPEHADTLASMNDLAAGYWSAGKSELALPLFEKTLQLQKAKLGPDHPDTLKTMSNLAVTYQAAEKFDKALPLFEETLQLQKAKLGPDHPRTLTSMSNLAVAYKATEKFDKALPLFEETLALRKVKLGPDHPHTLNSMHNLAGCYWSMKQLEKSVKLFEETLPIQEKKLGRDHPNTQNTLATLGVSYKDSGRVVEAIPFLLEAYRSSKKYPNLRWVGPQLLDAYAKVGERAKLTALVNDSLIDARKTLPKDSLQLAGQLALSALALLDIKGFAEAEPLLRECLNIREKKDPDDWRTFNTQSMLGGALLGQKKYTEAEPLLLKGYEGMKQRAKAMPKASGGDLRLPEALDRLIQFYTETNKPDEVKKWQAEKERISKTGEKK